jgi:hypothetical protein
MLIGNPDIGGPGFNPWPIIEAIATSGFVIVVWEAHFKPRRERAALARTLGEEVSLIAEALLATYKFLHTNGPNAVPAATIATPIFDAAAGRLDLRPVRDIARFYTRVQNLNFICQFWGRKADEKQRSFSENRLIYYLDEQLAKARNDYLDACRQLIRLQERLVPQLQEEVRRNYSGAPLDEPTPLQIVRESDLPA